MNRTLRLILILCGLIPLNGKAITYTGNFVFVNQTQLNNFPINFPNCTAIIGNVTLGDSLSPNLSISNLSSLNQLTNISGSLRILNCDALNSLNGLNALTGIGQDFIFYENGIASNLNGLHNLSSIGRACMIEKNSALLSLSGFSSLNTVGVDGIQIINNATLNSLSGCSSLTSLSYLNIYLNPLLTQLTGLSGLNFIGRLNIDSNNGLTSLTGLNPSVTINFLSISANSLLNNLNALSAISSFQGLFIADNNALTNLTGLQNITSIGVDGLFILNNLLLSNLNGLINLSSISGGALFIGSNASLNSLSGLSNLTDIGQADIYIEQNNSLTSLNGLHNIDASSITDVFISDNLNLATCHVQSICAKIAMASSQVFIVGNASGCMNKPQVQIGCSTLPAQLSVKLFLQGYYKSGSKLQAVLFNQGISTDTTLCDTMLVSIRQSSPPYNIVTSKKAVLSCDGSLNCSLVPLNGNYFISLNHRNSINTWSSAPVYLSNIPAYYDFSTAANKAYGLNMYQVESGVWAFYTGDIDQDQNVDLADYAILDADITQFNVGYLKSDINGDGNVDLFDIPIFESNVSNFIFSIHP